MERVGRAWFGQKWAIIVILSVRRLLDLEARTGLIVGVLAPELVLSVDLHVLIGRVAADDFCALQRGYVKHMPGQSRRLHLS